jgi:hypothetical protein
LIWERCKFVFMLLSAKQVRFEVPFSHAGGSQTNILLMCVETLWDKLS